MLSFKGFHLFFVCLFVCFFLILQDNLESDVRPFKAFHYNGLGVREANGTKKVHGNHNDDYKSSVQNEKK